MRLSVWTLFFLGSLAIAAPPKPNIVLLLADDLGWTDLAVSGTSLGNGSKYHQTPQLDRLAQQGMTFSSMYVQQNCTPTRAALMSGQYAPRTRMFNVDSLDRGDSNSVILPPQQTTILKPEAITMAETLQSAGYFTVHFGKWHMGPAHLISKVHGFNITYSRGDAANDDADEAGRVLAGGAVPNFFAHPGKNGWVFGGYDGGMKPFSDPYTAEYVARNLQPYANGNDPRTLIGKPKHLTDAMADAVDDFLGVQWPKTGKDKPFFMYVAFNQVHSPINPRPDMLAKYQKIDSTDPRHPRADYAAFVDHLDQVTGRILARLEDPNGDGDKSDSVVANTVVIFMSDNGGPSGATDNSPLRGFKGMHYDGGIRVPLMVRWPGVTKTGSTNTALLHAVDMYPTLSAIAGAKRPDPKAHPLDGESFAGVLRGSQAELRRKSIYWHFPGYMDDRAVPVTSVIKNLGADRYKLLYFYEPRRYELYKLSADIGEKHDLLEGTPGANVMATATDLRDDMLAWLAKMNPPAMKYRADGKQVPDPVPFAEATRKPNGVNHAARRRAAKK